MFTYLQTLYNTAAAAADSIRTKTACLRVHQPSRATKKSNLTFYGAGVPDEHNDANPTHNVMNTHIGKCCTAVAKNFQAPSSFTFLRDQSMGFVDTYDRD